MDYIVVGQNSSEDGCDEATNVGESVGNAISGAGEI